MATRLPYQRLAMEAKRVADKIRAALGSAYMSGRGWPLGIPDYVSLYEEIGRILPSRDDESHVWDNVTSGLVEELRRRPARRASISDRAVAMARHVGLG